MPNLIQFSNAAWYEGQLFYSQSADIFARIDSNAVDGYRIVPKPDSTEPLTIIR